MRKAIKFFAIMLAVILITGCGCEKKNKEEKRIYYKVTYEFNNGRETEIFEVEKGDYAFKPSNPTREGYNFLYWEYEREKFNFSTPIEKDITLEAKWEREIIINEKPVVTRPVVTTKPVTQTKIELEDISLNSEVVNLVEGKDYKLEVTYLPSNATDKNTYYSTSDSNVAVVENGLIKAIAPGTANIFVSTSNGIKKVCKVTVISNENYIIDDRTLIIQRPGTYDDTTFETLLYDEIIIDILYLTNNEEERKVILNGVIAPIIRSNSDDITLDIVTTSLETTLIVEGKNNDITSLGEIKDVEVNNEELKLELPNLADITVNPETTSVDFTYNISSKSEMMSNSFFTTYYNKFLDGDIIVESSVEAPMISGTEYDLDDTIYYAAVGTYDGDASLITEINIDNTTYDKTPKMLNVGNNAYIYAPVWKIDNGIFYIAYPYLNVHNKNNITEIIVDTLKYKVKIFNESNIKVESALGINTVDGYKNEALVEEGKITYSTEHKDHDLGIVLSDGANVFNNVEYLFIKNNDTITLAQVQTIDDTNYTYVINIAGEGIVESEQNYSNEYTIVVVNYGVTNITVDFNLLVKTEVEEDVSDFEIENDIEAPIPSKEEIINTSEETPTPLETSEEVIETLEETVGQI